MQRQRIFHHKASFNFKQMADGQRDSIVCCIRNALRDRRLKKSGGLKANIKPAIKIVGWDCKCFDPSHRTAEIKSVANDNLGQFSDEDDELCPAECVKEFKTDEELFRILERAKEKNSLVVVDFYRTSCGSCKYIEQIFTKLCKGCGDQDAKVIFLKHNVIDQYDEQSEVAERLRIKTVPLFQFYKDGVLLEAFPTRDKDRILAAIAKYTASASPDV